MLRRGDESCGTSRGIRRFERREKWGSVGMAILWLRVHYRERGHFAQKIRGVHQRCCTKVLPRGNEGPSNQTVQFYARMDRKLFSVCRVHCLFAKRRVALAEGMKP
jgi:hypothetical protein